MQRQRLADRLLERGRPKSFAAIQTRPPLLSSATRLRLTCVADVPGPPGCARLRGATVHPLFGEEGFSYRLHTAFSGPGSRMPLRH